MKPLRTTLLVAHAAVILAASSPALASERPAAWIEPPGHALVTLLGGRAMPAIPGESAKGAGEWRPTALAATDVDGDRLRDLIAAYAGPSGGRLALRFARADGSETSFLPDMPSIELPIAPNLLVAADLDGDGFGDAVVAQRGQPALWWLPGRGAEGFGAPREVALPGAITALSFREGLVVAVRTQERAELILLRHEAGTLRTGPASFASAEDLTAVAVGRFGTGHRPGLALAAGRELIVLSDDAVERHLLPAAILALATRERTGAAVRGAGLALLLADRTIALFEPARRDGRLEMGERIPLPEGSGAASRLLSLNLSTRRGHDLLLFDPSEPGALVCVGGADGSGWMRLATGFPPADILPMRLNADPLDDLVLLLPGTAGPSPLLSGPRSTFTVNSTGDDGDANLSDGVCGTPTGECTLRAAIEQANATASTDSIVFGIPGSPPHSIQPLSFLPMILHPVLLDATTQPGYSGSPVVALDGSLAGAADGLVLDAGSSVIQGLAIHRFGSNAIRINGPAGTENRIQRNYIGTDVTGSTALPNEGNGIFVFTGATQNVIGTDGDGVADGAEGNLISGNVQCGVLIVDAGTEENVVAGNRVGTNAAGTSAIANSATGVAVLNGASRNYVGTDGDGVSDVEERNLISGNAVRGVIVAGEGEGSVVAEENLVAGNYIGTDVTGMFAIPNVGGGLELSNGTRRNLVGTDLDGTSDDLERNVISGNGAYGVTLFGSPTVVDNVVAGNFVGTAADGTTPLGNASHGVALNTASSRNTIGGIGVTPGLCDGPCNRIANNGPAGSTDGVRAVAGVDVAILGNVISGNAGGAGIDLANAGPTANVPGDPDGGPNDAQNFPTLTLAITSGDTTTIEGILDSVPSTGFHLEFYANAVCDPSGFGEGEVLLGTHELTTGTDGKATFSVPVSPAAPAGSWLSATATRKDGESVPRRTSEFSPCFGIGPAAGAGRVPDGAVVPGSPLIVTRDGAMVVDLSWGPSCVPGDVDYAVYVGVPPDFTSHVPRLCTSGGSTSVSVRVTAPSYLLVVPMSATREGSYGSDSDGADRPAALPGVGCRPQLVTPCP